MVVLLADMHVSTDRVERIDAVLFDGCTCYKSSSQLLWMALQVSLRKILSWFIGTPKLFQRKMGLDKMSLTNDPLKRTGRIVFSYSSRCFSRVGALAKASSLADLP